MSHPPPVPHPVIDYQSQRTCPGCGGGPLSEPGFTWWGGAFGHKILGVERCESCRKWWVKKTGQPGGRRVAIYASVGVGLAVLVVLIFIVGQSS